jgi:pimeloyl-ACP methyl ester carboxylesterase
MTFVETTAGPIEVEEHGTGDVPVFLVGGLAMNASVWRKVIAEADGLRCVTMTQPLGSHRRPMKPDADLSLAGLARIQGEVMAALELRDVVLVGNDSGAFLATAVAEQERLAGLVVTTCEAFDRFPPGLPGRSLAMAARVPGAMALVLQSLRPVALRSTPTAFGWMAKHGIPAEVTGEWIDPMLRDARVRNDLRAYLLQSTRAEMVAATAGLVAFRKPSCVVWTPEDKVMDPSHGRRIADLLPSAEYHDIRDSYTLIPEDQPGRLVKIIRDFVGKL